jgi:uncharacterized protein
MNTRREIEQRLKAYKPFLKETFKVETIGIFGSYARDEASETSDVDLIVSFTQPIGWEFINLHDFLEEILGKRVDLATVNSLKPQLKDSILKEVVYT